MAGIHLANTTGRRAGTFFRYEFGEDLFGGLYLDVIRGASHCASLVRTARFSGKIEFLIALDTELDRKEKQNYFPAIDC